MCLCVHISANWGTESWDSNWTSALSIAHFFARKEPKGQNSSNKRSLKAECKKSARRQKKRGSPIILRLDVLPYFLSEGIVYLVMQPREKKSFFLASPCGQSGRTNKGKDFRNAPYLFVPFAISRFGLQGLNSTGLAPSEDSQVRPLRRWWLAAIPFLFSPTGLCGKYSHRLRIW